jgi:hypothetical protein
MLVLSSECGCDRLREALLPRSLFPVVHFTVVECANGQAGDLPKKL